jgi:hypothetical protein
MFLSLHVRAWMILVTHLLLSAASQTGLKDNKREEGGVPPESWQLPGI